MDAENIPALVPAREVARSLGVCPRTLTNWRHRNVLTPTIINGRYYYLTSEVLALQQKRFFARNDES
jgi:hypothetical protein